VNDRPKFLCKANVRFGSKADKPSRVKIRRSSDDVVLLTSGEEGVVYRLTYKWRSVNGSALRCIIKEIDGLPIQGTEIVGKRRCVLWRV
jgi:hypothetical protein